MGRAASLEDERLDAAIARTVARYVGASASRAARGYAAGKLRSDPVVRAVARLAPLGRVVDLGCGRGQLAVLLLEVGAADHVFGVDHDEGKIALARAASQDLSARFEAIDARAADATPADTVMLVDVLHYLPQGEQDALLARAASLVAPGGRLLVREATTGAGVRTHLTVFAERVGVLFGVNRGVTLAFRDVARELAPQLEAAGLSCSIAPCWEGTPLANVLLVGERPPA